MQIHELPKWGERIRAARGTLTQGELADQVGVRQTTISRWENNEATPSDERKLALAAALGQRVDELFPWGDLNGNGKKAKAGRK